MKERPILMSAPMVRAILAGTKTQTRRIMKVQPPSADYELALCVETTGNRKNEGKLHWVKAERSMGFPNVTHSDERHFECPYGQPGDRLWVRETWGEGCHTVCCNRPQISFEEGPHGEAVPCGEYCCGNPDPEQHIAYRADGDDDTITRWRPSIHMPRWASRILLEVVSVRVERLQDISGPDALEEGFNGGCGCPTCETAAKPWYRQLWEDINGPDSWETNPYVWVVEFKVIKQ